MSQERRKKVTELRVTPLVEALYGSRMASAATIRIVEETADVLPRGKVYPEKSGRQLYGQYRRAKGGPGLRELGPVKGWPRTNIEVPGTDAWRGLGAKDVREALYDRETGQLISEGESHDESGD